MATSRAGSCVQLFNKDTNTAIGSEVCNASGADSIVSTSILPSAMPSSARIEARMRSSTGAAAYVTKVGLVVRIVSIEKMVALQRIAPAVPALTATTNFVENRAFSSDTSYGTATTYEFINCLAKANTAGSGTFQYKGGTAVSGTTGSNNSTTFSYTNESAYTMKGPSSVTTTNNQYQFLNYAHSSGSFMLSHCLYEVQAVYPP